MECAVRPVVPWPGPPRNGYSPTLVCRGQPGLSSPGAAPRNGSNRSLFRIAEPGARSEAGHGDGDSAMKPFLALAGLVALSACGSSSPQDNAAERLDRAAEQSDPAAAEVLHNKADAIRENEAGDPG